jgi:flagellar hook-length control protein FliK
MPTSPATTTEIVTEIVTETGTPPGSPAGLETESEPPSDAAPAAGAVAPGPATPGRDAIASTTGPATTAGRTRAATTRGAGATTDPAGAREPGSSALGPAPAPADPDARSASRVTGPPASGATDLHGRDPRATTPNSDHATGATSASSAPSGPAPAVTASTSAVDAAAAAPVATGAATGVATAAPASTGSSVPTPPAPATLPPYVQVVAAALPLRTQGDGSHRITMQLAPPELGRVEVEVHVQAGEVRVHLRADEAAAGALLHESIAELRRSLETQGLRVVDVAVDTRAHDHDDPGTHRRGLDESPLGGAPDDRSPTDDDVARRNARTAPEPVDATGGLHLLDLHI